MPSEGEGSQPMARERTDIEQAPARHVCGLCRRFVLSISRLFDASPSLCGPPHVKPLCRSDGALKLRLWLWTEIAMYFDLTSFTINITHGFCSIAHVLMSAYCPVGPQSKVLILGRLSRRKRRRRRLGRRQKRARERYDRCAQRAK